ncbi:hypothetical protein [Methanospirillum lacunae]|uniref:Uncharacterized protein n=2 Tax=Methanospirillum lacunae TaxID=668570 RepID=A0A2V2MY25_9EURY|nr:hypothetical protein [Methanospirillum lacunae]PWR72339.1 hypothetical protein DK846_09335 [Methanospirillum lacunae]
MAIIRPRLNDYYNIPVTQNEVDFAIPYLDEDIPLYLDPFLLWKSPSQQDNSLHTAITNCFNNLGKLVTTGKESVALDILIQSSECNEVGLGNSKKRKGTCIGEKKGLEILSLFKDIPQIKESGFVHFEEIQLYVESISKDRVSDIACNFIKSFLIDFTLEQCDKYNIPIDRTKIKVYDYKTHNFIDEETYLPQNPSTREPILLVPKRWLRFVPWINSEDYCDNFFAKKILKPGEILPDRIKILSYNRNNYDQIQTYLKIKERSSKDCANDPLFTSIPILSAKNKISTILKIPTGKDGNADKKYENNICQLLPSIFYPHLDFASEQSRTDSGILIRDLIFYNNRSLSFLQYFYDEYNCRQIVFELKNVKELLPEHINQVNRYLCEQFGKFGIIVTRNPPLPKIVRNTINLWGGNRKCILILSDSDIIQMCNIYENKQRFPIEVINKKYVEFTRLCPS